MATDLVTLAEVKSFIGISGSENDTLLAELIDYYTAVIETYTQRSWTKETQTEYIDGGNRDLIIGVRPITSITSITDTDNSEAVDSDDYDFDPEAGLVFLVDNATTTGRAFIRWGSGRRRWKVIYLGGIDGAGNDIKLAANKVIAGAFNRRDSGLKSEKIGDYSYTLMDTESGLPADVEMVLSKYKEIVI